MEQDFRARLQEIRTLRAPVEEVVNFLFPRMSQEEREGMVRILRSAGMERGGDLRRMTFGYAHDKLKLPDSEKVCKVLLDRGRLEQGGPEEIMWYGAESFKTPPDATKVPLELNTIARYSKLDHQQMVRYARAATGRTWIQFAKEHMSEEEQADALCNISDTEIIYAFRAMLRIISQVLPVRFALLESRSFIGTLYLTLGLGGAATDPDWSKVVWVLQAKPPGMYYLEAMGRLVMSIQLMFANQPLRKFAVGVIAMADVLDVYMFWGEDLKVVDAKVVPVARSVTNVMLTLDRIHSGVELLMMFMCTHPHRLGYLSEEISPPVDDDEANGDTETMERLSKLKLTD